MAHPHPFDLSDAVRPFADDTTHASYDPAWARRDWQALSRVNLLLEEFAGRFSGKVSPVHHCWHTFDIAPTRFSDRHIDQPPTADPVTRKADAQQLISFGLWFGDDRLGAPAFSASTAPKPAGLADQPLGPAAAWWDPRDGRHLAILGDDDAPDQPGRNHRPRTYADTTINEGPATPIGTRIEEAQMDQARARALLAGERARLQRLLQAQAGNPPAAELGDEVDDAHRRDAEEPALAVDQRLGARWAALQRAEARLAAGSYGRSLVSGQPIPDQRLEPTPGRGTVQEAATTGRGPWRRATTRSGWHRPAIPSRSSSRPTSPPKRNRPATPTTTSPPRTQPRHPQPA